MFNCFNSYCETVTLKGRIKLGDNNLLAGFIIVGSGDDAVSLVKHPLYGVVVRNNDIFGKRFAHDQSRGNSRRNFYRGKLFPARQAYSGRIVY